MCEAHNCDADSVLGDPNRCEDVEELDMDVGGRFHCRADSWLMHSLLERDRQVIQRILNGLSDCITDHEELLKLWNNLNNVNTARDAMADGLSFLENVENVSFKADVSFHTFEKLVLELDEALRNMEINSAIVLEQRESAAQSARVSRTEFFIKARTRRNEMLFALDQPPGFQFDDETTFAIWKKWEKEWTREEEMRTGIKIKRPRNKFESYCHMAIKGVGKSPAPSKHLAWLVIRTGRVNDDIEKQIIEDRSRKRKREDADASERLRRERPYGSIYNVCNVPFRTIATNLKAMVIAVDSKTKYCQWLVGSYPRILNCCIVVRDDENMEWDEDTEDSGAHEDVRRRMKEKHAWRVVREAARYIFESYGMLLVVCNYGKQGSLSLGYEIARDADCEFVAPRDRSRSVNHEQVLEFLSCVASRVEVHEERFGRLDHPIRSMGVCTRRFDGPEWMNGREHESINPEDMHVLQRGDLVLEWRNPVVGGECWAMGAVIHDLDVREGLWFPCVLDTTIYVQRMKKYFFPRVLDIGESVMRQWKGRQWNEYFESDSNEQWNGPRSNDCQSWVR